MENQGLVVPRLDILDQIWGPDVLITPRTIDSHIGNLRKKICTSNYPGHAILSIRGVGYKLSIQEN
ncbi:MAG: winged helix-turn-helix transcriptional regulator [Bacteroidetes bacterium]|nr:winged helix-turn-helix transcriptional regulator [Bacteroidota bacterium]